MSSRLCVRAMGSFLLLLTVADRGTALADTAEDHNRSGLAYQEEGYLADAAAEFRRALQMQPELKEADNNLGLTLLAEGDTEGAVEEFRKALKTDPQYTKAINNLGLVFLELGRWNDAITQYRALIALDAGIPEAYFNLGSALKHNDDYGGAAEAFERSVQLDPSFPEAHCSLGEVLWEQGKLDEAVMELRSAVSAAHGGFLPAYQILASLLLQKGDIDGALAVLQQVVRVAPQNGPAFVTLGMALKKKGDIDGAAKAFQTAQTLSESANTFQAATQLTGTGALLRRQGNFAEAAEKLQFALRLAPDFSPAHYQLGLTLLAEHRSAEAEIEFNRVADPRLRPPRE